MPKRTNTFQQVVTIVHAQLAGGANVEESVMLTDRVTGVEREVDAVVRSDLAGHEMVLSVEATTSKATLPWVEQLIAKHRDLPTDHLVLVAEKGASKNAYRTAERNGVALIVPQDLTGDDPSYKIVNRLESVWPKGIELTPEQVEMIVRRGGGEVLMRNAPDDLGIFLCDGRSIGVPITVFHTLWNNNSQRLLEMVGIADIAEDRDEYFVMGFDEPSSSLTHPQYEPPLPLCLRWMETGELHTIAKIEFTGRAVVHVSEMRLTHRRFKDTAVAYGEAKIGGQDALIVVSEDDSGGTATLAMRDTPPSPSPKADPGAATGYAASEGDEQT